MTRTLTLKELKESIADPLQEGRLCVEMRELAQSAWMRLLHRQLKLETVGQPIPRAVEATKAILTLLLDGVDLNNVGDPGHGLGHWGRDYIHSLYLAHDPELEPKYVLPCVLGGTLHDLGSLYLDRYADKNRAFRHAEAGALLIRAAALESGFLNRDEADLVAYVIAAHTHYLKSSDVTCADTETRRVYPYRDVEEVETNPHDRNQFDLEPMLEIWLPRWVDRLDCSGPCLVARHFMTLAKDHEDFGQQGFYKVSFAEHMRPLLRSKEEITKSGGGQTMLEHLRMFADSQTNDSPYGKYDRGRMVQLRDAYRASLKHIIDQVAHPTDVNVDRIMIAWMRFLSQTVEPTLKPETARALEENFRHLDTGAQRAWACGFRATMAEFQVWGDRVQTFLETLPDAYDRFPGLEFGLSTLIIDDSLTHY